MRARLGEPLSRPAISRLAASRLTSHSHGPGQRLVEVVDVEDHATLRRSEHAEVREMGVAAELDSKPGVRGGRQVACHDERRAAEVGERRHQHAAVADRHELGNPRRGLALEQSDRVRPLKRRAKARVCGSRHLGAGIAALRGALRDRRVFDLELGAQPAPAAAWFCRHGFPPRWPGCGKDRASR